MPTSALKPKTPVSVPNLDAILGKPPVLPNEDAEAYEKLNDQFRRAVNPQDVIEEILLRDVVDITWEIQRLKDYKMQLLQAKREYSLQIILENFSDRNGYYKELYGAWKNGDKKAIKLINGLLSAKGLDPSAIDAFSFRSELDNMERFDRLIMQAEARRMAHLREVDRHRASLAAILRDTVAKIDDGKTIEHAPAN
jgi:hypothetical protein